MNRSIIALAAATVLVGACARQATVESTGTIAPSTTLPNSEAIPSGTNMEVRLNQTLGTEQSKVGDTFTATVQQPLSDSRGDVVVPEGTVVHGTVTGLHASQHAGDQAVIQLDFNSLDLNGQSYPFAAKVNATNLQTQGDTRNQTLKKAGIGAAAGAALGAILSKGDLDKILLGGALGAATGTAISLGAGDVQAVMPAGTIMTLQSTQTAALR